MEIRTHVPFFRLWVPKPTRTNLPVPDGRDSGDCFERHGAGFNAFVTGRASDTASIVRPAETDVKHHSNGTISLDARARTSRDELVPDLVLALFTLEFGAKRADV